MRPKALLAAAALALALSASPAHAEGWRFGGSAGAGFVNNQTYFQLGARIGYDVFMGLTPELSGQYWLGASPSILKLAPGITWYAPIPFHPYLGAYYAHWFVGSVNGVSQPDQDSLGGRAGLNLFSAAGASVSVGLSYERIFNNCVANCDVWSPEVMAGISF